MRTLGVDLASQPKHTAICVVEWRPSEAVVTNLQVKVTDDEILNAHEHADVTGIDCPFGWPEAFLRFVSGDVDGRPWSDKLRDELRFRLTDHRVKGATGRWPLSVSSDLVAVPAMRCQTLLRRMHVTDRSGDGRVFEVYPAASLAIWGFPSRGYKGRDGAGTLGGIARTLRESATWLHCRDADWEALETHDHAFDALIAALTARAACLGLTERPSPEHQPVASREGWIALPLPGSLAGLSG